MSFFLNFLHIPEGRSFRDEGQFFYGAERILNGELIYRDFHEIQFPGGFYLIAAAFYIFGERLETGRVLTYIFISAGLVFYFLIIQNLIKSLLLSIFPLVMLSIFCFTNWAGSIPHWFTFMTSAGAIFFFSQFISTNLNRYLILSGIFSGLSLTILQHEGLSIFLSLSLFYFIDRNRSFKKFLFFSAPFFLILLSIPGFFILKGAFKNFIDSTFSFVVNHYTFSNRVPYFGYFTSIIIYDLIEKLQIARDFTGKVVIYFIIASYLFIQFSFIIYIIAIAKAIKNLKQNDIGEEKRQFLLLIISGLFMLLSQIHRFEPTRLIFISGPAFILFSSLIDKVCEKKRNVYIIMNILFLLCVYYPLFVYTKGIIGDLWTKYKCYVDLPGGKVYLDNQLMCAELNSLNLFISGLQKEEKKIYIHNWAVQYYFLLKLNNPVPVDGLLPGHNSVEQYVMSLKILEQTKTKYIITDDVLDSILKHPEKSPFPAIPAELLKNDPIWDFIRANYKEFAFLPASGLTLWKRRDG